MIRSVHDYAVSHYFNPDGAHRFFIPKYQREFVWGKSNWEALLNDLEESPKGHFLGSIICVNNQNDAMSGGRLELIDGQQRFTTITLLFCALYAKLKSVPNPDDELNVELINLKNRIFVKLTGDWRFEPSEQGMNRIDFQKVLAGLFPEKVSVPKNLKNFGNRRISRAHAYFCDRLKEFDAARTTDLLEKLKAAILVKIEVPSHSDAFVLFETINNRGIPLSAIDIIKNNLLAELDKHPQYGIDRAFDEWRDLIELLPEPAVQERFLRQLYNAFRYLRRVAVRGCPRATRSNLIAIYDTLLRKHPVWLFEQLRTQGKIYAALHDAHEARILWGACTANALRDLGHIGAAPAYTFLLWTSQVARDNGWSVSDTLAKMAPLLTRWFFWRNLTDTPATRELDQLFMDLIEQLLTRHRENKMPDQASFLAETERWLRVRAAPSDVREARLNGDVYVENYEATRFMLCKLEEAHQTRENQRDLWAMDGNERPVFTVEHILPKTENLGEEWSEMLAFGTPEAADAIRQRCAHRLGNLTLTGYNSKLGVMPFLKKRDRRNDRGDFIGYRNGLYLNAELANREGWNETAIQTRTAKLVAEVKALLDLTDAAE